MRGRRAPAGVVGLLVRAAVVLTVSALLAEGVRAAIPLDPVAAGTGEGGAAFAVSVLRAVSAGTFGAAACVLQVALLVLFSRAVRAGLRLLRERRAGLHSGLRSP
ncbi:hypothetical protein [Streptomyces poriticola]|uniref:hypothetical protein n=1 Tax=Streptomyces poriticola TaxID=3120506 RepID=UPI002FCE6518